MGRRGLVAVVAERPRVVVIAPARRIRFGNVGSVTRLGFYGLLAQAIAELHQLTVGDAHGVVDVPELVDGREGVVADHVDRGHRDRDDEQEDERCRAAKPRARRRFLVDRLVSHVRSARTTVTPAPATRASY